MQLIQPITVSIPKSASQMEYRIDREELLRLKECKWLLPWQYVGLAIKISYPETNPIIDIGSFCKAWGVTESELHCAIATLNKKGALQQRAKQLELNLFSAQQASEEE